MSVVFLEAYRRAVARGDQGQPIWDPRDSAECLERLYPDQIDGFLERRRREQAKARFVARMKTLRALEREGVL